jgi:hypothetical protein
LNAASYNNKHVYFRSTEEEEEDNPTEDDPNAITISVEESNQTCNVAALNQFWPKAIDEIRKIGTVKLSIV